MTEFDYLTLDNYGDEVFVHDVVNFPNSSLVSILAYNREHNVVGIVFHDKDKAYFYRGVPEVDFNKLSSAPSVGRDYNEFKRAYGPAEVEQSNYIIFMSREDFIRINGEEPAYDSSDFVEVPEFKSEISNDYVTTGITSSGAKVTTINVNATPNSVVSLATADFRGDAVTLPKRRFRVGFETGDGTIRHYESTASDENEFMKDFGNIADALGVTLKVKELTKYFD